jgi:hypothetical protein
MDDLGQSIWGEICLHLTPFDILRLHRTSRKSPFLLAVLSRFCDFYYPTYSYDEKLVAFMTDSGRCMGSSVAEFLLQRFNQIKLQTLKYRASDFYDGWLWPLIEFRCRRRQENLCVRTDQSQQTSIKNIYIEWQFITPKAGQPVGPTIHIRIWKSRFAIGRDQWAKVSDICREDSKDCPYAHLQAYDHIRRHYNDWTVEAQDIKLNCLKIDFQPGVVIRPIQNHIIIPLPQGKEIPLFVKRHSSHAVSYLTSRRFTFDRYIKKKGISTHFVISITSSIAKAFAQIFRDQRYQKMNGKRHPDIFTTNSKKVPSIKKKRPRKNK